MAADQHNPLTPEEKAKLRRTRDRETKRANYLANPEKYHAAAAKWRAANPEKQRELHKKWNEENRDRKRENNARYRSEHIEEIRAQREGKKAERSAVAKKWYEANREKCRASAREYAATHREDHAQAYRRFAALPENRMRMLVSDAKTRAKKRGLEFDGLLHIAISLPEECPCCLTVLDYSKTVFNLSPSLDRIDNTRGYTLENVRVICRRCNSLKRDASIEDLEKILAYMRLNITQRPTDAER